MIFAETVIQVDATSLIAAATAVGGAVGGGIVAAAKMITSKMDRLHMDNREDRDAMLQIMNQQWEQLSRLAQNTRVTAEKTIQIGRKVGATPDEGG